MRSKHQVIFNGDWGAMFWAPNLWQPEGGPYSARALHSFVELLAENQVDTYAISPNTQLAWYPSKVVPTALDDYTRGDKRWARWFRSCPDETNIAMMDRYLDLLEAGVDWMAETIVACKQRQVTPWASVRMNDPHGYLEKWVDNPINCPLFKDPDNRLRGTPLRPGRHADVLWVGLNFERQAVRDYFLDMIRELVLDYDTEGLELDFLRTPAICEPNASQQTIDTITEWIGEIRALTRRKAEQTGRPFPMGLRIPAAFGALRSIGLDVAAIADAGLIDFVSPSNYMQTAWDLPLDQLRQQLGPDIAIYGNVEFALNGVSAYSKQADSTQLRCPFVVTEALLGATAGQRALGADGIELYNYYAADEDNADIRICTRQNMKADYTAIQKIGDLESLRGQPKQYAFTTMLAPVWNPPFDTPDSLPDILEPDWRRAYRLPMCAEPADAALELVIQIVLDRRDDLPELAVSFNDSWPTRDAQATDELLFPQLDHAFHVPEYTAFNYRFDVSEIREGWNEISVYNGSHEVATAQSRAKHSVTIRSIELAIKETTP
ncbi:MAG: hypothetical protein HOM68_11510 [Gemmatimonadetes bacterium]|jgi:hypothetical protein|nr:hypothetical protein [Gemmatimonadota bacterium]MBT5057157.1 hypothetical protein [Gemmatimonadota bacterium]MBT5145965.1 hypothetical protein [Gemmatimonadota bacterium]MBT5588190.1 hypothetical protein [Gemmatimonadota bacterium]MBT5961631.1 hypothetical protein [Gemmatimonadota bacterium]